MELTPEGIVLVDDDDEIIYANTAAKRLLGRESGTDLCRQSLLSFVADESVARFEGLLDRVAGAETGTESALEHLQRLELWLLRWAVEQSDGGFEVETRDGYPLLRLRFDVAD